MTSISRIFEILEWLPSLSDPVTILNPIPTREGCGWVKGKAMEITHHGMTHLYAIGPDGTWWCGGANYVPSTITREEYYALLDRIYEQNSANMNENRD